MTDDKSRRRTTAARNGDGPTFDGPETMPTSETGWWEAERAELIRRRVTSLTHPGDVLGDVGCGRGSMLSDDRLATRTIVRIDSHLWQEWRDNSGLYVCAHAHALPFRSRAFDLVGSFDVLEHLPDDELALREQCRLVREHGHVVAAVPADPRLWSAHDDAVGHLRRYTSATLLALAERVGLSVDKQTHFFSYLWIPARLFRSSSARRSEGAAGAVSSSARMVRAVIHSLSASERWVISRWRLPIGSSLWLESHRPG